MFADAVDERKIARGIVREIGNGEADFTAGVIGLQNASIGKPGDAEIAVGAADAGGDGFAFGFGRAAAPD